MLSTPSPPAARRPPADVELVCAGYLLNRGQFHPYLRTLPEVVVTSPRTDQHSTLYSLASLMSEVLRDSGRATGAALPALVDLLLVHGLDWAREQMIHHEVPPVADAAIASVLRAVHTGLDSPWTVERLSAVAGMPRAGFSRRFHALLGEPPMAYVLNRRLSHAAVLLRTTRDPHSVVARQVGYANEFAFATAFRRRFGIAPGRYRHDADSSQRFTSG